MTLKQDLIKARASNEYWQTQHNMCFWGVGICVAVFFFSFMSIFIEEDEEYVSRYDPAYEEPGTSWQFSVCGASTVLGFLFVGYGIVTEEKMKNAVSEVHKISHDISVKENNVKRKKTQERKRKNQEKKRKSDLEKKELELEGAKKLMEEGGIENLNKAIGIFKKHEK
jgi:hypothetical protein